MLSKAWANRRNWYAFLLCISCNMSVYRALDAMGVERDVKQHVDARYKKHSPKEIADILALRKQGLTYKAIGERHELSWTTIYNICRYYQEREAVEND